MLTTSTVLRGGCVGGEEDVFEANQLLNQGIDPNIQNKGISLHVQRVYEFKDRENKNEHMCLQKPSVINALVDEAPSTSVPTNVELLEPIYDSSGATYTLGLSTGFLPFNASSSQ